MLSAINSPFVRGVIVTTVTDRAAKFICEKYQFKDEKALRGITVCIINVVDLFITLDLWGSFPGLMYGCSLLWMASIEYGHLMNHNLKKLYDDIAIDDARTALKGEMRV